MTESFSQTKKVGDLEFLQMDFGAAMSEVLKGRHVRRLEWEDENVRLAIVNEQLMIFLSEDESFHPLLISEGDISGEDWVVVEESKVTSH